MERVLMAMVREAVHRIHSKEEKKQPRVTTGYSATLATQREEGAAAADGGVVRGGSPGPQSVSGVADAGTPPLSDANLDHHRRFIDGNKEAVKILKE